MKRLLTILATAVLLAPAMAVAATVDHTAFRYERTLTVTTEGPVTLEPDGQLFAHTEPGFADLRILDVDGEQVPWRMLPEAEEPVLRSVRVLDSGWTGRRTMTAHLDLGPHRQVVDQAELALAGSHFVGHVTVLGSDDRRGFTRLSTTTVYDLGGGAPGS